MTTRIEWGRQKAFFWIPLTIITGTLFVRLANGEVPKNELILNTIAIISMTYYILKYGD